MKKIFSKALFLSVVAFLPLREARAQENLLPLSVATIGQFHGDEITMHDGDPVLVFGLEKGRYVLKSNVLHVELAEDVLFDEDGAKTGKVLSLQNATQDFKPEIILKGDMLSEGDLQTAKVTQDCIGLQDKSASCSIEFNDLSYSIDVIAYPVADRDDPDKNFVANIVLRQDDKQTSIERVNKIIWAGDLDRDGALDLIIDGRDHYNVDPDIKIYLSSLADNGLLLGLAGSIRAHGC